MKQTWILRIVFMQILLVGLVNAQYSVQLTKEFWSWQINGNEMEGNLVAKLLLNGQSVDTTSYLCTWYRNWNNPTVWEFYRSGFQAGRHGITAGDGYNVKAIVTQPGNPSFSVETQQYISAPAASQRSILQLHSELENQQPAIGNSITFWAYPDWHSGKAVTVTTAPVGRYFTHDENVALRTQPNFRSDNQKFSLWLDDNLTSYHTNHQAIETSPTLGLFASQYKGSSDYISVLVTLNGISATSSVEFLDPWSQDYPDPTYGNSVRNRGLSAPFVSLVSGSNNLGYSTAHQGVFLNQEVESGIFYSVRAPLVQIISGSAAFFVGWSYDPNKVTVQQVGSNPSGYDQKAVIFKQAGATVTAQYTNSSITQNTTIPAGTYQMAGSLTVSSGVTLTLSPGTILQFPSGATLTLNGKLIANGTSGQKITFTRKSGSSDWIGFSLTGSGANASSLQHCIISYAKQPIVATNVGSMTINNCLLDNSSFYNSNGSDAAALRFYNSSPTITSVTINGLSGSWNGVRFAQGSTGSISSSTIQNLGAGNGIVVQGGSSPLIRANTIQNNYYHGIIVVGNGSGNPVVISNSVLNNGVVNGVKTYVGIDFYNSTGKIGSNTIQGSNYGYYFDTYASPTTWWTGAWWGFVGNNTMSNNLHGFVAYNYSNPIVGRVTSFHGEPIYQGTCNNILNNTTSNAYASVNCYVEAAGNWWGQAPPDPAKIQYYSGSFITSGYYGTPSQPCPGGGGGATLNPVSSPEIASSGSVIEQTHDPVSARLLGDFAGAREAYVAILGDESLDQAKRSRALVGLYEVLRDSKDGLILQSLVSSKTNPEFATLAEELIMNSHVILGNYSDAAELAQAASNSEVKEKRNNALLLLASLDSYSAEYSSVSQKAKEELKTSGVNEGILVALGMEPIGRFAESGNSSGLDGDISLSNYPNPFNPSTNINFTIPEDGHVSLRVFDMLGRVVESLLNETRPAGSHQVSFNGAQLPSGVYFYRLEFNGQALSRKFVLTK